jgi:hypothetical protein
MIFFQLQSIAIKSAVLTCILIVVASTITLSQPSKTTSASIARLKKISSPEAYWTPAGVVLFTGDVIAGGSNDTTEIIILKSIGGAGEKEITRLKRSTSLAEFSSRVGVSTLKQILKDKETTEQELWQYVSAQKTFAMVQSISFEPEFAMAMGVAWRDETSISEPKGTRIIYTVKYVLKNSTQVDGGSASIVIGEQPKLNRAKKVLASSADSSCTLIFMSLKASSQQALYARVFRATDEGKFEELDAVIPARKKNDTLIYFLNDEVEREKLYRYYILPCDRAGNSTTTSDTVSCLSINYSRIPMLRDAKGDDSPEGVILNWKALPEKPYWAGIEIKRRSPSEQEYMPYDTIAWKDTTYLDKNVRVNAPYNYSLKVLLSVGDISDIPSGFVTVIHENKSAPALPPNLVRAVAEKQGVRVSWLPTNHPDVQGYYVFRSVTPDSPADNISGLVKDSSFLDRDVLDGRTTYVYTVKSVLYNEVQSGVSNQAYARPDKVVVPPPPGGISSSQEAGMIRLMWIAPRYDDAVVKYNVYRREIEGTKDGKRYSKQAPALQYAASSGFVKLNSKPVTTIAYDDNTAERGKHYEYTISSVDYFDNESGLSEVHQTGFIEQTPLPPSSIRVIPSDKGVIIQWSKQFQDNIREFVIYRRLSSEDQARKIGTVKKDETYFSDANPPKGVVVYSVSIITTQGAETDRSRERTVEVE